MSGSFEDDSERQALFDQDQDDTEEDAPQIRREEGAIQ